jgi:hypothetical protein
VRVGSHVWNKNFEAPKRADLRGWWNAVRRAVPGAELPLYPGWVADVTRDTIIFCLPPGQEVMINRSRRL